MDINKLKSLRNRKEYKMIKYRSNIILEEDLKIETDRYWDEEEKRVEVVKLTMISTNLEITFCSYKGQLDAYNKALRNLEIKYKEWLLDE